jgi:hypothetical protein
MDKVALDVIGAALSIAPLPLIYRWLLPKSAIWVSVLLGVGSAALAVCFFGMWRYLEHPVLAYLDALVYGLLALLFPLVAFNGRWTVRNELTGPSGRVGLDVRTEPEAQNGPGMGSL